MSEAYRKQLAEEYKANPNKKQLKPYKIYYDEFYSKDVVEEVKEEKPKKENKK